MYPGWLPATINDVYALSRRLDALQSQFNSFQIREKSDMAAVDTLKANVASLTTAVANVTELVNRLSNDPQVQAAADQVKQATDSLAALVAANPPPAAPSA